MLLWETVNSSLWFIPTLLVLGAALLATLMLAIDGRAGDELPGGAWWLFNGTADGARTILSVIAGSVVTVVAVVFSVTMIAIQQASTQYTPRILRNFTRDRGNQVVLGAYIATFVYSLLVLRQVRSEDSGAPFVPTLSIFTAMVLSMVSLGLLIYFIHHSSQLMQVSQLLARIREELDHELEHLFPSQFGPASHDPSTRQEQLSRYASRCAGEVVEIRATEEGYVRSISEKSLLHSLRGRSRFVSVEVLVGQYVQIGDTLIRAWSLRNEDGLEEDLRQSFILSRERTVHQDPAFAVKQLVDIALRALSPSTNDPTTAEQAIDQLVGAVGLLGTRELPSTVRELEDGGILLLRAASFADYVDLAFGQIRHAARTHPHVTLYLLRGLASLARRIRDARRLESIRSQLSQLMESTDFEGMVTAEREKLLQASREISEALQRHGVPTRLLPELELEGQPS